MAPPPNARDFDKIGNPVTKTTTGVEILILGPYHELENMWLGAVPVSVRSFSNVKSLVVEGCEFLSNAILPSHLLPFLQRLEELEVKNCNSVEAIFDVKDTQRHYTETGHASTYHPPLKKITLEELPNMKHVWNDDPQGGITSLPFLEEVCVEKCEKLKFLFPASEAKYVLKRLAVKYCVDLEEIVAKEEGTTNETNEELIIFPNLTSLALWNLKNLKCFYPGKRNGRWPMLTMLDIYKCPMLKVSVTEFQNSVDSHTEHQDYLPTEQHVLFSTVMITSQLEELSLDKEDVMMIEGGQFHVDFQKLKYLRLLCFHDESDVFPYDFFSKVPLPCVEKLALVDSNFKEIFLSERPKIDDTKILSQLKDLVLNSLPMLKSIGLEHSWVAPFTQSLEYLEVIGCKCLRNLVASTVSFSRLKQMILKECHGLEYMFTSSTAKSLRLLTNMSVENCKSLQEIVFEEAVESLSHDNGEIIFEHLDTLSLNSLPSLGRFCNGTCVLKLPSLEQLSIIKCSRMVTFTEGTLIANKLSKVKFEEHADAVSLKVDLNSTIWNAFKAPEHLVLGDYHELDDVWLGVVPVPDRCFSNLKSLAVERCDFLSKAMLPSHLLPFLRKLEELKVKKCNSIEAIFDVKDTKMGLASPLHLGLKKMTLEELPTLKHVWNEDPQVIISLPFLEEVVVDGCKSIKSLFPTSVAKGILKTLEVGRCEGLVEIVAKDEASTEGAIEDLTIFLSLTSLRLWKLPKLKCFYPGMHNQEWPMLTVLDCYKCPMLKVFITEFRNCIDSQPECHDFLPINQQALISADKVTPHLEELSLNKEDVIMIEQGQVHVDLLKLKYLKLQFFNDELDVFPYVFLSKVPLPCIERIEVGDCTLKEIFPSERPGVYDIKILSQLKGLELNYLPMLKSIGLEHSWIHPFTQRLKTLNVRYCNRLTNLVSSTVSFAHLTQLIVKECYGLEYLFTSSTAKSLCLLRTMSVKNCKSVQEIVFKEAVELLSHDKGEIIFEHLDTLSLHSLPSLGRFCNGTCVLKLPSLEQLSIIKCSGMVTFTEGTLIANKLSEVKFEEHADAVSLKVDLNSTIWNSFEAPEDLILGDYHELENMWLGVVPVSVRSFSNVKSLVVEGCEFLSNAILPSHLLPFLKKLEMLEVKNCNSVEAIFDVKDTQRHYIETRHASTYHLPLKKITLEELPNLKNVWNDDPQGGITSLPFLEEVCVEECEKLKFLFPASEAKCVLKRLVVKYCVDLEEIVAKDEGTTNETNEELIIFPNLTSLALWNLKNLKCFYPGKSNGRWPMLTMLDIYKCPMLKVFVTEFQNSVDSHTEHQDYLPTEQHVLFSTVMITSQLEELSLDKEDVMMIEGGQFHVDFQKLKYLRLMCFHDESDVFPYVFFSKVPQPCVEKLALVNSYFKEIFLSERPKIDDTKILSQLKDLVLNYLPMLKSIGLEHSWVAPFTQSLEYLEVIECKCLRNLVASTVSFSRLTQLILKKCHGLEYMFTSSTAKSLRLLTNMSVENCKSLQEIVFEEAVESLSHDNGEIIFEHLDTLSLNSLPSLGRFCNGTCVLKLPSWEQLSIIKCSRMVTFTENTLFANKLSKVKFEEHADAVSLKVDLNSTIWNVFKAPEHLVLGDYHELDDVWLGVVPVSHRCFSNLKSLVVERCDFLSKAMLPSHLLPFLSKLEELKVQKCNSVEVIFDVKDTKMGLAFPLHLGLKKMILEELPTLKYVWNEDPQVIISFPFLEKVVVDGCNSIKFLFPTSVAKGILKTLDVRRCEGLVEIVAKDEASTEGAIEDLTIFVSLTSLTLWNLPKLNCLYPGMHNQEWPMLTMLNFYKCPMLKVFVTEFQNCLDSQPECHDFLPINQQALISADKVTPHLEELSLNKEDVIMIEQGQVHVDLLKLKFLKLRFFNDELDVFPYVFLSKVPLPCIERIKVGDCTLKEIFPSESPDVDDTEILSQLKGLELNYLPMLKSIGLEHSWIHPFTQRLKSLNVICCDRLTNLVPSTVSFTHLTELIVDNCDGLEYLFTSSTAKSLGLLEKMEVSNCKSLKKIVEEETKDDEPEVDEAYDDDEAEEDEPEDEEPEEDERGSDDSELIVDNCDGLEYLSTSSTAKSLGLLEKMEVSNCKSFKKIVEEEPKDDEPEVDEACDDDEAAEDEPEDEEPEEDERESDDSEDEEAEEDRLEEDESEVDDAEEDEPEDEPQEEETEEDELEEDESEMVDSEEDEAEDKMIFGKLKILSLNWLPTLGSFYTGSSTLKFESLKEVSFTQCHNMKVFCHGDLDVPDYLVGEIDGDSLIGDINTTIKQKFEEGNSRS